MTSSVIRPARRDDLDGLERLENRAFSSNRLSRRSLRYYLDRPSATFLVLQRDGDVIGDVLVAFRQKGDSGRLYSLAVDPEAFGHGYGRLLLAAAEQAVATRGRSRLKLEVRVDNKAAIGLYRASGYRDYASIPDYYEDGETALCFEKQIAPEGGGANTREGRDGP